MLLELAARHGTHGLYAAADAPEAGVPGYWERFWVTAETLAREGKTVVLLDEVHLLPEWAAALKGYWTVSAPAPADSHRRDWIVGAARDAGFARKPRRSVRAARVRTLERRRAGDHVQPAG